MNDKTTLVMSYNEVEGFKPGSHGNGRVVIMKINKADFEKPVDENEGFGVYFQTWGLCKRIEDAYIYIGDYESENDPRLKAFMAMLKTASAHIKDRSKITLVGCNCEGERKRAFAKSGGCPYINCECGGKKTLGRIVKDILATLPKEPEPVAKPVLKEEFVTPDTMEYGNAFVKFASVNGVIFAGRYDGLIFAKNNGHWEKTGLKLKQGVNVMVPDKNSLLLGDGSCCSGATWRLNLNGSFEQIVAIDGQHPDGKHDCKTDLNGNIYGFARLGDELLVGGGGCCGTHIYRLNKDGKWEYLPNDPEKYVTAMVAASDDKVYVVMMDSSVRYIYCYNGQKFERLGYVGQGRGIFEHQGALYVASTDSGMMYPTSFSNGCIYKVEGGQVKRVYQGNGGIDGFFTHKNQLYAFGASHVDWSTQVLKLADGEWQLVAKFEQNLEFFCHNDIVYAGGEIGKEKEKKAVIYNVENL